MDYFKPSSERLAEALERARRGWQRRLEPPVKPCPPRPIPPPFTIALSDEAGANGPAVAYALGERLGWQVYDHELVDWIARETGVRADLLKEVDERRVGWLEESLQALLAGLSVSELTYVHHLGQTLLALASHGECVIVGRGAAQALPPATTLRVRLVGPLKDRVAAIQRHCGLSPDEAARWVKQRDRERSAFVKEHFHKDPTEPDQYDLLLNAFRFSAAECAEITGTALRLLQERPPTQAAAPSGAPAGVA
jgi:cytidylate kinase